MSRTEATLLWIALDLALQFDRQFNRGVCA
jgi:hypothetical protein